MNKITVNRRSLLRIYEEDSRICYEKQNCENISLCKEGLHHLARPVLGFYEMLRVCIEAAIIIEPYDTFVGRILEFLNFSSTYEQNIKGNIDCRDNYFYRWSKRTMEMVLNSYYLESGYNLDVTLGWINGKSPLNRYSIIRRLSALGTWTIGFVPGNQDNYMTAVILPGRNLPPKPIDIMESKGQKQ